MSARLAQRIAADIRLRGPLRLDAWMRACMLDDEYGYYATGNPLGRDFTTAPEISQMFGELLGLWCADMWPRLGAPSLLRLVELGPGRGTMLRDALRTIGKTCPAFASALEVHLVEVSPVLHRVQGETLAAFGFPLHWHTSVEDISSGPMLLLANEFFDALPVRQFEYSAAGWREVCVGLAEETDDDNRIHFAVRLAPAPEMEKRLFAAAGNPAAGDIVELCPEAEAIARHIGMRLGEHCGAMLVMDYGSAGRPCGASLGALRRDGRVALPDAPPGGADLSAWVDFRALANAAQKKGRNAVRVFGPIPQGGFLRRLGIVERAARLNAPAADLARLVDPAAMGAVFKAMALVSASAGDEPPTGFLATEQWHGANHG